MRCLRDPGVRAMAVSGVVIGTLAVFFADSYGPVWIGLGALWLAATVTALVWAYQKAAR